jgi:hypothetical protein
MSFHPADNAAIEILAAIREQLDTPDLRAHAAAISEQLDKPEFREHIAAVIGDTNATAVQRTVNDLRHRLFDCERRATAQEACDAA